MGPLFSLAIATLGMLFLLACVTMILWFKHAPIPALGRAVMFVAGFAMGLFAAGVVSTVILGVGRTLESSFAVSTFLGWLCLGGLGGGFGALSARIG